MSNPPCIIDSYDKLVLRVLKGPAAGRLHDFLFTQRELAQGPDESRLTSSILVIPADRDYRFRAGVARTRDLNGLPQIIRDGVSPPWMDARSLGLPGERITDPLLQRTGALPFTHYAMAEDLKELTKIAFGKDNEWITRCDEVKHGLKGAVEDLLGQIAAAARTRLAALKDHDVQGKIERPQALEALAGLPAAAWRTLYAVDHLLGEHWSKRRMEIVERACNVVIQGLGDLSMNAWNVAYLNAFDDNRRREVFAPIGEPLLDRTYTCLVAAREHETLSDLSITPEMGGSLSGDLLIARVRLSKLSPHIWIEGAQETPAADLHRKVEFAVYGKAVIWAGRVIQPVENIDEWGDIRHVFDLPNLNPDACQDTNELQRRWHETGVSDQTAQAYAAAWSERPRLMFGIPQSGDVWLFEEQLLSDANLRRLACHGPIGMVLASLPAPRAWIDHCLEAKDYRKQRLTGGGALQEGEYAWESGARTRIQAFLRLNRYACTIVGIGRINDGPNSAKEALFALAIGGNTFAHSRFTIWDCAEVLKDLGCRYALVFDEGHDVFQAFFPTGRQICEFMETPNVETEETYMRVRRHSKRNRLRAHLAIWQMKEPGHGS